MKEASVTSFKVVSLRDESEQGNLVLIFLGKWKIHSLL